MKWVYSKFLKMIFIGMYLPFVKHTSGMLNECIISTLKLTTKNTLFLLLLLLFEDSLMHG